MIDGTIVIASFAGYNPAPDIMEAPNISDNTQRDEGYC
jgi:hypothetical protein